MLVASDNINGVAGFEWTKVGDAGAIEVPDRIGHDLINRDGGHYWAVDGTKPAPKAEPKAEPTVELKEDESTGDDIAEALDASNVGVRKPAAKTRKTTSKE
jgi:hypothetical protein